MSNRLGKERRQRARQQAETRAAAAAQRRSTMRFVAGRVIFHGNRGELRQPYREGQEDRLAALGFALNVLVLWNTQYMDDAIGHLRRSCREITTSTSRDSHRCSTSTS